MKFRAWTCVDCDPTLGESEWDRPYTIIHEVPDEASYERAPDVDYCPRCESHYSWSMGSDVEVTPIALVKI